MANDERKSGNRGQGRPRRGGKTVRTAGNVDVRRVPNERSWELVHPRCALQRAEDLEEVDAMIDAGEIDIAIDELRWLLSGCSEFIQAHRLLGELVLTADKDYQLARGHFGFGYQLGISALRRRGKPTPLPYQRLSNQGFFESGKGLAYCLIELGKTEMAREVLDALLYYDPSDPLGLVAMKQQLEPQ